MSKALPKSGSALCLRRVENARLRPGLPLKATGGAMVDLGYADRVDRVGIEPYSVEALTWLRANGYPEVEISKAFWVEGPKGQTLLYNLRVNKMVLEKTKIAPSDDSNQRSNIDITKYIVNSCGTLFITLCIVIALVPFFLLFQCLREKPPTPEELKQAERLKAEYARETAENEAFARAQQVLWNADPTTLTASKLIKEMSKCRTEILKRKSGGFTALISDYDINKELPLLKSGNSTSIELVVQQRVEGIFINNKVQVSSYMCTFKGAGFLEVSRYGTPQYMDNYVPD